MSKPFFPPVTLDVLLRDEKLKEMLALVEVKDNSAGLLRVYLSNRDSGKNSKVVK